MLVFQLFLLTFIHSISSFPNLEKNYSYGMNASNLINSTGIIPMKTKHSLLYKPIQFIKKQWSKIAIVTALLIYWKIHSMASEQGKFEYFNFN